MDEPLNISSSFLYDDSVSAPNPFYGFQNQTGTDLNDFDKYMGPSHGIIEEDIPYSGLVNLTSLAFFIFYQRIMST